MDLNELLVFTRVAQLGSFTAAARAMGMPKSSVSKKVADLEERLGVRLLQRTTRRLGLTDPGRLYFARTAQIVADIEDAEHAVTDLQGEPRGLLRVTVPLSFSFLDPVVSSMLESYPGVQLEVVSTDRVVDLVHESFDLAIRAGALRDSTLVGRRVGAIRNVLVAAPRYLRGRPKLRTPEDLAAHACIAFGVGVHPDVWTLRSDKGEETRARVTARLTVNELDMILEAARAGLGIAWLPAFMVEADVRERRLKRILPAWSSAEIPVHAVYPSARHVSPKVVAFVERVRARFGG